MIQQHHTDPLSTGLNMLKNSVIGFYACGSRFFGDSTGISDFDFFTDDKAAAGELELLGFKLDKQLPYRDVNCVEVWSLGRQVHVIIVKSVESRIEAQTHAKFLTKKQRRTSRAWDAIYKKVAPELFE